MIKNVSDFIEFNEIKWLTIEHFSLITDVLRRIGCKR